MRLTEAQARRLGVAARTASGAPDGGKRRRTPGRNRCRREEYAGEPVRFTVELPFDPKPKERPRTVSALDYLAGPFAASSGSADAFLRMAAGVLRKAYAGSGGRFDAFCRGLGRGSRTFTPKATADYERLVATAAAVAMKGRPPFECPVETRLVFVLAGDALDWPTSHLDGDSDNMEKAVMDALNGVVFADDRLVVRSWREKACGEAPRVEVHVAPAAP